MSRQKSLQRGKSSKPSIAFHMIRHAHSNNNKVYEDAKTLFRFGSPDFDSDGFQKYVDAHRRADPHLSPLGMQQADTLASEYLNPAIFDCQASSPVRILCSPMLRTLLTIRPTLERLILSSSSSSSWSMAREDSGAVNVTGTKFPQKVHLIIVSFYHEIEGCHSKGEAEPGMNPDEIRECLFRHMLDDTKLQINQSHIDEIVTMNFVGFPSPRHGWYGGNGHESRVEGEARAAKYCLWLTDYLDSLMYDESEENDSDSNSNSIDDDDNNNNNNNNNIDNNNNNNNEQDDKYYTHDGVINEVMVKARKELYEKERFGTSNAGNGANSIRGNGAQQEESDSDSSSSSSSSPSAAFHPFGGRSLSGVLLLGTTTSALLLVGFVPGI